MFAFFENNEITAFSVMLVINVYLLNFSNRVNGIISSESFVVFFSKIYRRHHELVKKFNVGLTFLLLQGLSKPEFYGDLVYKSKKKIWVGHIFLISFEK